MFCDHTTITFNKPVLYSAYILLLAIPSPNEEFISTVTKTKKYKRNPPAVFSVNEPVKTGSKEKGAQIIARNKRNSHSDLQQQNSNYYELTQDDMFRIKLP
jgi:hypothetical protein